MLEQVPFGSREGEFLMLQHTNILNNEMPKSLWQQTGKGSHMGVMVSGRHVVNMDM